MASPSNARDQFGDPAKIGIQVNTQFNNGNRGISQEELEETRKRLDRVSLLQQKWKAGTATNAELREHLVEKIEQLQHLVDCLDAGETPDQETQQELYRDHEESSGRQQSPIKEAIGHVTDSNDHAPLAIEDAPETAAPGTAMRASDTDPSSGKESQTPPEHLRQQDRKPHAGPLSLRQNWLKDEKARRGGEGKNPF